MDRPALGEHSSLGHLGQEIPFNRQLANLGIKLRRLALILMFRSIGPEDVE